MYSAARSFVYFCLGVSEHRMLQTLGTVQQVKKTIIANIYIRLTFYTGGFLEIFIYFQPLKILSTLTSSGLSSHHAAPSRPGWLLVCGYRLSGLWKEIKHCIAAVQCLFRETAAHFTPFHNIRLTSDQNRPIWKDLFLGNEYFFTLPFIAKCIHIEMVI